MPGESAAGVAGVGLLLAAGECAGAGVPAFLLSVADALTACVAAVRLAAAPHGAGAAPAGRAVLAIGEICFSFARRCDRMKKSPKAKEERL